MLSGHLRIVKRGLKVSKGLQGPQGSFSHGAITNAQSLDQRVCELSAACLSCETHTVTIVSRRLRQIIRLLF